MNPHHVKTISGTRNLQKNIIKGPFNYNNHHFEIAHLNHYFSKSFEEFLQKRARGKADCNEIRSMDEFYAHDKNEEFDDSAWQFYKKYVLDKKNIM